MTPLLPVNWEVLLLVARTFLPYERIKQMFVNIFASGGLEDEKNEDRVGIFCYHLAAKRSKARTRSICGMFSAKGTLSDHFSCLLILSQCPLTEVELVFAENAALYKILQIPRSVF